MMEPQTRLSEPAPPLEPSPITTAHPPPSRAAVAPDAGRRDAVCLLPPRGGVGAEVGLLPRREDGLALDVAKEDEKKGKFGPKSERFLVGI